MDPNANPYRPGAGARPPALTGRDDLLSSFGVAVRQALAGRPGQSMLAVGLRGVGKTVLLSEFKRIAEAQKCIVLKIEAPENDAFIPMLGQAMRSALLQLDSGPVSKLVTRALRILKGFSLTDSHGFKLSLDLDPERGVADSGVLEMDLADLFEAVGRAAIDRKVGIVLTVDEIQYLNATDFAGLIVALHRAVQEDLPIVLVGAGLPRLPALAGAAKSYAERLFVFPRIGALDRASADKALIEPVEAFGMTFEKEALDRIYERTRGYPYFIQEFAHAAWNAASGPLTITARDVEVAIPIVNAKLDGDFFSVRLSQLTPAEKHYIFAMASLGVGPYRSSAIARQLSKSLQEAGPLRESLLTKGMIHAPDRGLLDFTVPLFDEFLRRYPHEPARKKPEKQS